MKSKLFLTDVDNCLLDWSKTFGEFIQQTEPGVELDLLKYDFGIGKKHALALSDKFNKSPHFENIVPYQHALKYVPKIVDLGFKFVAVTSCLGNELTYRMREKNLLNVFGDVFEDVICIPMHANKKPELEKFDPTYWADDKLGNCIVGWECGHKSFLIDQKYNEDDSHHGVIRVKSWREIYQLVKQDEER